MKAGIIHFSDIHIGSKSDDIVQRKEAIAKACKAAIAGCTHVIIVITGDLAFSGLKCEYDILYDFLKDIEQIIKSGMDVNTYKYVIVPGNHDCNFNKMDSVTSIVRESVKKTEEVKDSDVRNSCLKPQQDFWEFYSKLIGQEIQPAISFSQSFPLQDTTSIHFNCYNSSFLSEKYEKYGNLFIPESSFIEPLTTKNNDIVVSIFHHNTSWLSPNIGNNNKRRFEQHLIKTSNVVMCGHEHTSDQKLMSDLFQDTELVYLEGAALQEGFSVYLYSVDESKIHIENYAFTKDYYTIVNQREILINSKRGDGPFLNTDFADSLNKIEAPIKHPIKSDLLLNDIFVWQDLETICESHDHCIQYEDANEILVKQPLNGIVFIEGESQSGKTSLIKMLMLSLYRKGEYSILIKGKDIKHPHVENLLKQCYKKQYQYEKFQYEKYRQIDKEDKVILIDDFNDSSLNYESKYELYDTLLSRFKAIVIITRTQNDVKKYLLQKKDQVSIKRYHLSSLGYVKRNQLIERWVRFGKDAYTVDEYAIEREIKLTFDQITLLLGEQLVPPFPIFILSLLQSLNPALKQYDVSPTSYAFCYKSLIIASLWRSGVSADKTEGVMNFLQEFAYHLYSSNTYSFNKVGFRIYYNNYSLKYNISSSSEELMKILCDSNIFKQEDEKISFSYRYIYYYLTAAKISRLENRDEITSKANSLCEKIHEEESANILIFLIHLVGNNQSVIDDLLLTSMLPFEDTPISRLDSSDLLFETLAGLIQEIKHDVLLENTNFKEEREKALRASDRMSRQSSNEYIENADTEDDAVVRDLNNALKITKILGQIVKNHSETFEKTRLVAIIEEAYRVSFRTLSFFTKLINDAKEDIVQFFLSENRKVGTFDGNELQKRVGKLLQFLLYRFSLSVFSNLTFAVGNPGMREIYDEVAKRLDAPTAKIVSFTIKSYYNKMTVSDLEEIVKEFKDNPVVMEIIKAWVIQYVYHNPIDIQTRQKFGQICKLKLVNNALLFKHQARQNKK